MINRAALKYADSENLTSVMAADARGLILIIHERIFDHLKVAKSAFEVNEMPSDSLLKASDLIIKGLLGCLDYDKGKEIAQNLSTIYLWATQELLIARAERSPNRVQNVIDALVPLYEAWTEISINQASG